MYSFNLLEDQNEDIFWRRHKKFAHKICQKVIAATGYEFVALASNIKPACECDSVGTRILHFVKQLLDNQFLTTKRLALCAEFLHHLQE